MNKRIISALLTLPVLVSSFSAVLVISAENASKTAVTETEKAVSQTPEEVEPVQWVKASEYENYNEIEVSRELREALVIPGDPKDIKIMAAKEKKGFLYLLDRMPAILKFEPVSGTIKEYLKTKKSKLL